MKNAETKSDVQSKPLILSMNEAEQTLFNTVNKILTDDGIPCYFVEIIVDKIHKQLKNGATLELEKAKKVAYAKKEVEENGS